MNADANLHFVFTKLKGWLARRRNGAGCQSHTHAAALIIHLARQLRDLPQRCARLGQAAHDLFQQHGNAYTAPPSCPGAILDSYVVVGYDAFYLDSLSRGHFSCHLEVQHVTRVILDDMQHACATIHSLGCGKHLIGYWRSKNGSRAGCIEHAMTNKASVHWLMTTSTTRDDAHLAPHRSIGTHNNLVFVIDTQ